MQKLCEPLTPFFSHYIGGTETIQTYLQGVEMLGEWFHSDWIKATIMAEE